MRITTLSVETDAIPNAILRQDGHVVQDVIQSVEMAYLLAMRNVMMGLTTT